VVVSLMMMVLLSPLFIGIIIWIKLDSSGPVFYSDKRIGIHGRIFRLYKFRTMVKDAHVLRMRMIKENKTRKLLFKHKSDPRITCVGRILRKYSLDELPQFWNVLRGEMSIVGPRPHLKEDFETDPHHSQLYRQYIRDRHRLWPGLTGLW